MKIIKGIDKIEFTDYEKEIIEKMNELTDNFFMKNNLCTSYDCNMCPFQAFCSDNINDVYQNIEKFLNGTDWR